MKSSQKGVLEGSDYYFDNPSGIAKRLFFYTIAIGEFFCDKAYETQREQYNSFLLMQIESGDCYVTIGDKECVAHGGEQVLINCYKPHRYYAKGPLHFQFLHFDGNVSEDFYEIITKKKGNIFPIGNTFKERGCDLILSEVLTHYRGKYNLTEADISGQVHRLLGELLQVSAEEALSDKFTRALDFVHKNYGCSISVREIADEAGLSVYHFSRNFKQETGYSPYEYLTYYRMERAKKMLKTTKLPVNEIGYLTGFKSDANFISCFQKWVGLSPGNFRKLPF